MATINYKCDTCKRDIELIENRYGLTTNSQCIITKSCRGKLFFVKRNPNNVRAQLPAYDIELDDYTPRKLLHIHTQELENLEWEIQHNFGESTVFIVYDALSNIVDNSEYTITTISPGVSLLRFLTKTAGMAHVLSRTGGLDIDIIDDSAYQVLLSPDGVLTFAIPKYITRMNSAGTPILPPPAVPVTPPVSNTPLPSSPSTVPPTDNLFYPCDKLIRIEIEVLKPNEPALTCTETLDDSISIDSAWYGWNQILVRNRKHYCLKTKKISELKVFTNTNDQKINIPDGTRLRIKRIDYGTSVLVNIPDRGLLMMLTDNTNNTNIRNLSQLMDCGELVNLPTGELIFKDKVLYATSDMIETTYPLIKKYT